MAVQNFGSGGGGFQLSPGVNVSEIDLTTVTPAVDTSVGAIAGVFRWGPVNERVLVISENDLVRKFGKPTNINPETFFTAANFLAYSNALYVARSADTTTQFAAVGSDTAGWANTFTPDHWSNTFTNGAWSNTFVANTWSNTYSGGSATLTVFNNDDYDTKKAALESSGVQFIARWPGDVGNSLKVSVCETEEQYTSTTNLLSTSYKLVNDSAGDQAGKSGLFDGPNTAFTMTVGSNIGVITLDGGPRSTGVSNTSANGSAVFFANSTSSLDANTAAVASLFAVGDHIVVGSGMTQTLKIVNKAIAHGNTGTSNTGTSTVTFTFDQPLKLASDVNTTSVQRFWEYYSQVNGAPGRSTYVEVNGNTALQFSNATAQRDELHVVVVDEDGGFTGSPGNVLEVYQGLSRATDSKNSDGTTNYYKNIINDQSTYVWVGSDRAGSASNTAMYVQTSTNPAPQTLSLLGGSDIGEDDVDFSVIADAYDKFVSPEDVSVSLIMTGGNRGGTRGEQKANYLIDNLAETRKDCVVFVSPRRADVVNNFTSPESDVVATRNSLRSTSYAVMDSGYKYQYDKYNDVNRWIPLNGDIAGLCARTDATRDPWFSPAGDTRGQIKNSIKLAFNPNQAQRDILYKNGVNPVISQMGRGTILFGDKTLQSKPSSFDRINVRRLFIVLERTISAAAKSFLFEFNDEFTRTQFRNLVEPFLRDVMGRRGIYDFKVVCDGSNNPAEVVDASRFVGDIYIKPARSINFIQLNFVAVRSGVEFSEIVG